MCLISFFFKQKPASEMRISYWSSDVCSSDLKGRRIAFAPKQTATITPVLTIPMPWNLAMRVAGDAIFQGDQYTDTDLDPHTHVGGYWQYAARVIIGDQNEHWSLTLGGSNLSDKKVLNQVRSEEHTSELQSLMRMSYAVFCLKKK